MRRLVWELLCNPKTLMLELWNTEWWITEAPKTFTAIMALLVVFCISTQVILRLNTLNNVRAPMCHGRFKFSCWYNAPHCKNVILVMVKLMIPSNTSEDAPLQLISTWPSPFIPPAPRNVKSFISLTNMYPFNSWGPFKSITVTLSIRTSVADP